MKNQFVKTKINKVQFLDQNAYSADDVTWYPSVTTVLSGGLPKSSGFYEWLKNAGSGADDLAKSAMDKGSRIHNACELLIAGLDVNFRYEDNGAVHEYSRDEWVQINRFVDFHNRFNPEYLVSEGSYVSETLKVGGTIDIVCVINDETWLLDVKTGKALYEDYALQLAAYKHMLEEATKTKIDRYGVLWLNANTRTEGKKGSVQGKGWQVKEYTKDYNHHLKIFKNVRENFDYLYPKWKPFNQDFPIKLSLNFN